MSASAKYESQADGGQLYRVYQEDDFYVGIRMAIMMPRRGQQLP